MNIQRAFCLIFLDLVLQTVKLATMAFQNCPASKLTISYTKCPSTHEEWMFAVRRKNCSSISQNCTSPENFRYHCVSNAFMNETIEVCAPGLFLLGFCPEYNFRGERIQDNYNADCKQFAKPCPNRYESWKSYKFSECLNLKNAFHSKISALSNKTSVFGSVRKKINSHESDDNSTVLITCLVGLLTVLIVSAFIFVCIYRRKRRKPEINFHEEEGVLCQVGPKENAS
ncbi:uncharacterized protein LOC134229032 isoform X2 [Saccostrea cucullata]|uniref:uncharacterized protein LOC134229032 isoform X2 n=1 Tax=Saccostrea cuccullata TaxID=36930 RepID=UPI002ED239C1